jgi:hypothetical protein
MATYAPVIGKISTEDVDIFVDKGTFLAVEISSRMGLGPTRRVRIRWNAGFLSSLDFRINGGKHNDSQ